MHKGNNINFGFIKDNDNLQLNKILKNNNKLKEIHIDMYADNPIESSIPFVLLLRVIEKNIIVLNDGRRLAFRMNNIFNTYIMNILLSDITECFVKIADEYYSELILNVKNIYYKITVFG